jgi:hypothetical protein
MLKYWQRRMGGGVACPLSEWAVPDADEIRKRYCNSTVST